MGRTSIHNHTYYSNIRILDALANPEELIDRAVEIGLDGIAITEHGNVCSAPRVNFYEEKIREKNPNFKVILGTEIYLTDTRKKNQQYYHCVLLARDAIGHKMLRELTSIAWLNSYFDRGMERVPSLRSEVEEIITKYGKGHLIMTQSCLGGRVNHHLLGLIEAQENNSPQEAKYHYDIIVDFVNWADEWFGDDFYFEVAPAPYPEQIKVNRRLPNLAKFFNKKIVIGDDAHRVRKEDYVSHKALLNSQMGEREDIDKFYLYTYLQTEEEIKEHLKECDLDYDEMVRASEEIYNKIERFSLRNNQHVNKVEVPFYPKEAPNSHKYDVDKYPTLDYLMHSEVPAERYWINYCQEQLIKRNINNDTYLAQLETEADIQKTVGEKLNTCLFNYPIFLNNKIDLFWENGTTVGVGRGSSVAGLNHYLFDLVQLDCIEEGIPHYWRFLNKERLELPDIDIDIAPSVRPKIFEKIREKDGELSLVQVCTFGTMTSKSAVQSACRGYRTEDFPDGIDTDIAKYMTSLIPQERGFVWSISDTVYGNAEKNRKPVLRFIDEVNKYPGLLEIILKIEGCISRRGTHASGVLFLEKDHEFDEGAIMRSPDGSLVTQYDLHMAEACGAVKYDLLVTEIQDIITQTIKILQEHNEIDPNLSLREAYNKYIAPNKLPLKDPQLWKDLAFKYIPHKFQFDSLVGNETVKLLQPQAPNEMADANSIMRLMAPEGWDETPSQRYARMKNDISYWYDEMNEFGLTNEEQKQLEKHYLPVYGSPCQQEQLMLILMDENICNFTLKEANNARKIVAKKQMDKIPALRDKIFNQATSKRMGEYIWYTAVLPQCGYSFSILHSTAYSYIGLQTVYLATKFNPIYWNTACMRVESGLEESASTDYNKIAKAMGNAAHSNIKVSLIDINKSKYMFEPHVEKNTILYSLKALNKVGGEIVEKIIQNRPYSSVADFESKVKCNVTVMVSLIKAGAFDEFGERKKIMEDYIWSICKPKKKVTLQNFQELIDKDLLPKELNFYRRLFVFNKALKANCKEGSYFKIEDNYYTFFSSFFDIDYLEWEEDHLRIDMNVWKKLYDKGMEPAKLYLKQYQEQLLAQLNNQLFKNCWDKYAAGSYSSWEMESLGFYYHEHELANVLLDAYGIKSYNDLPESPEVDYLFKRNGREIPIYKTCRIAGTVIAKEDNKKCISVLTPDNQVVTVKFNQDQYAHYNRQISEVQIDGTKKVMEKSFFQRGTLVVINGYRRGDTFVVKRYKKTPSHSFYKITSISDNGTLQMTYQRYGEEVEEE